MKNSVKNIQTRFKGFDKDMRDAWESYCLVEHLAEGWHTLLKADKVLPLKKLALFGSAEVNLSKKATYGAMSHLRDKTQPRTALLESVALFEDYLAWLVRTVLTDSPFLLKSSSPQAEQEGQKLLNVIVDCSSRDEIIEQVVEEKVRGIFYGNPVDFFKKGKGKMEFGDYFKVKCDKQLEQYAEITARRNVIAHNNGRVDRKYLREVKGSTFKLGQAVPIKSSYLKESISLLVYLAARATELILKNHYKSVAQGRLASRLNNKAGLPPI